MENGKLKNLEFLAKYPFLDGAKKYVEEKNLTLYVITKSPVYGSAIKIVVERIKDGISGKNLNNIFDDIHWLSNFGAAGYEICLISFPLIKIFLNLVDIGDELKRRYVKKEGELFEKNLKNEDRITRNEIFQEIFNQNFSLTKYKLHFVDYLSYINDIKDERFDLINRRMDNGFVEVDEDEMIVIARNIVEKRYIEPIDLRHTDMPEIIVENAKLLKDEVSKIKFSQEVRVKFTKTNDMPPSIAHIIQKIENKEKISHNERFVLACYLINKGMGIEEIKKIFSHSPDYDEKKTSYYLNYISKRKYITPSYETMKSLGIWISEEEKKFKNPLAYKKKDENF